MARLFFNHSRAADKETAFAEAIGSDYAGQTTGLPDADSYSFYVGRLSIRKRFQTSVAYGGGRFVIVGHNGEALVSTDAGQTWVAGKSDVEVNLDTRSLRLMT